MIAAVSHAKTLPYVDPAQVYLGGHSTGGTVALLAAAALPKGALRGVISIGPVARVADYGARRVPFDTSDAQESKMRAPVAWLQDIQAEAFLFEGETSRYVDGVREMTKRSKNPMVHGFVVPAHDHFSLLAPLNELLAEKIVAAAKQGEAIAVDASEVATLGR